MTHEQQKAKVGQFIESLDLATQQQRITPGERGRLNASLEAGEVTLDEAISTVDAMKPHPKGFADFTQWELRELAQYPEIYDALRDEHQAREAQKGAQ